MKTVSLIIRLFVLTCVLVSTKGSQNCKEVLRTLLEPQKNGGNRIQARDNKFEEFDWQISKELNGVEKGNIVLSPLSLKVVLAMLYEGATGKTAEEIENALDVTNCTRQAMRDRFGNILNLLQSSKEEYEVKMGSHVFIDKLALPKAEYVCKLQEFYNSDMKSVDFHNTAEAVKVINDWASNITEGHIQHLVTEAEAHENTIMLLLNAVYFKGYWLIPFPENQTEARPFYLNDKQSVSVPMMNVTEHFYYTEIPELDAQMIKLPYKGEKFFMYVVLPNNKTGLDALVSSLGPKRPLLKYTNKMFRTPINLILPKFEFDFTTSLRPTLEKLGIQTMFGSFAELSEIAHSSTDGTLIVSNILQKAGISVTEVGTVAFAATVAELQDKFGGGEDDIISFKADHPFLFFIQEDVMHTTVFVGKVTNPENVQVKVPTATSPQVTKPSSCIGTNCASNHENKIQKEKQEISNDVYRDRQNYLDAELLREVSMKEKGNFVMSPASVKLLLGLVMEAAEGSTLSKIQDVLRLPYNTTEARQVLTRLHNVLEKKTTARVTVDAHAHAFISNKYQTNNSYSRSLMEFHKAEVSSQDFSSAETSANYINNWIKSRTRGLISKLIEPAMITSDTLAVLVSAIYFDGVWKTQFLQRDTKDKCFYSFPNLACQNVPMMSVTEDFLYKFDHALDTHILQIPYEDERYSMVLVVPHKHNGISQLSVNAFKLSVPELLKNTSLHEVNLKMPRFTVEHSLNLKIIMEELGLAEIFSDKAQLPYMLNNVPGKVSSMVHRAKIEVSEKGTKASAASAAGVVPLSYGLREVYLEVNHAFFYFVYEQESQTVLFSGRLSSMTGAAQASEPARGGNNPQNQPFRG